MVSGVGRRGLCGRPTGSAAWQPSAAAGRGCGGDCAKNLEPETYRCLSILSPYQFPPSNALRGRRFPSATPRPASSSPAGLPSPTPLAGSGNLFNPSMPPSIAVGDLVSEGCLIRMEARNCFLICYSDDALLCVYVYHATQKWSV